MSKRKLAEISALLDRQPYTVPRSGSVILKGDNKKRYTLATPQGKLTALGKHYYDSKGEKFQPDYDDQELTRVGNKEYIVMRDGSRRLARTLVDGEEFTYTKLGKAFVQRKKEVSEFIVHVPILIRGRNKKTGAPYERVGHVPHTAIPSIGKITLDATIVNQDEREAQIKKLILERVNPETLLEVSDETYKLHDGAWKISRLQTKIGAGGEAVTAAVLNRPLGGTPYMYSHLPFSVHPSALEPADENCCLHQLCQQLGFTKHQVETGLDEVQLDLEGEQTWRDKGVSAMMVYNFCQREGVSCKIFYGHSCLLSHAGKRGAFYASIWSDHLYGLNDKNGRRKMPTQLRDRPSEVIARPQKRIKTCADTEEFTELKAGNWHARSDQMSTILADMISQKIVPQISMRDFCTIKQLATADTVVRVLPEHKDMIEEFVFNLSLLKGEIVEYEGQGLAHITLCAFNALLKSDRRMETLQEGECVECGRTGLLERDHTIPHSLGGQTQVWRCVTCHRDRTLAQDSQHRHFRASHFMPALSWFNPLTKQEFLQSSPKQIVRRLREHEGECMLVDVQKCRASALTAFPLPVFCALDDPVAGFQANADFYYVTMRRNILPLLTGSRWYHCSAVEYALHKGTLCRAQITWSLTASGHLQTEAVLSVLAALRTAWARCSTDMSKQAINACIGLMGSRENHFYSSVVSAVQEDTSLISGTVAVQQHGDLQHWVSRTKLLESWSYYPIYHQCLDIERLRLQLIVDQALMWKTPKKSILEFRTDAVLIAKDLSAKFGKVTMAELGFQGDGKAYHVSKTTQGEISEFDPASSCKEPTELAITTYEEDAETEALALSLVDKNESVAVWGSPGTGKTHLCKRLVQHLRDKGQRVECIALTHTCARLITGGTIQAFLHRYVLNGSYQGWIWLDECGLVGASLWNFLGILCLGGVKWILSGDCSDAQLGPPCNVWAGKEIHSSFFGSRLMMQMSSHHIKLTVCKRSTDHLHNFFSSLTGQGSLAHVSLADCIDFARQMFPRKDAPVISLVISHANRQKINERMYQYFARGKARLRCKLSEELVDEIFAGCRLIGAITHRRPGLVNGAFYTVDSWDANNVTLRDTELDIIFAVQHCELAHCRLGYALTYASVQGRSIDVRMRLCDVTHPRFTRKHLSMGLSRATSAALIDI